jgi:hypothetical protein
VANVAAEPLFEKEFTTRFDVALPFPVTHPLLWLHTINVKSSAEAVRASIQAISCTTCRFSELFRKLSFFRQTGYIYNIYIPPYQRTDGDYY